MIVLTFTKLMATTVVVNTNFQKAFVFNSFWCLFWQKQLMKKHISNDFFFLKFE